MFIKNKYQVLNLLNTGGGANSKLKLFNLFNCFPLIEEVV